MGLLAQKHSTGAVATDEGTPGWVGPVGVVTVVSVMFYFLFRGR